MNGAEPATEPVLTVLLADDDLFESGYIKAVLMGRGITVAGPFTDLHCALRATQSPGLRAAVIAQRGGDTPNPLTEELARRGVPYLTLTRRAGIVVAHERPTLVRPFAAHQVADWVVRTLEHAGSSQVDDGTRQPPPPTDITRPE